MIKPVVIAKGSHYGNRQVKSVKLPSVLYNILRKDTLLQPFPPNLKERHRPTLRLPPTNYPVRRPAPSTAGLGGSRTTR